MSEKTEQYKLLLELSRKPIREFIEQAVKQYPELPFDTSDKAIGDIATVVLGMVLIGQKWHEVLGQAVRAYSDMLAES